MSNPGYGPSGFMIRPVGLATLDGNAPPETKRPEVPPRPVSTALGFGKIPRRIRDSNTVFRNKES